MEQQDMSKSIRMNIILPAKLRMELRIMCALTNKKMSDFIRIAIQDKIKQLRNQVPN